MLGWVHVTAFTYAIPFVNKTREEKKTRKKGLFDDIVKGFFSENW